MFRFKQFTIIQENAAMKVCTDACLFGALIEAGDQKKILDIGTGTGLLALMLAQKNRESEIVAVEIDRNAVSDATANFHNSPYSLQIQLVADSIQAFSENEHGKFNCIVSNPPFFQNNLKSSDLSKNNALHNQSLSLPELAQIIAKLLEKDGKTWILLPPYEMTIFQELTMKDGLFLQKEYCVKHNPEKEIFRKIGCFGFENFEPMETETIHIYENEVYSTRFAQLLKDYYLIF